MPKLVEPMARVIKIYPKLQHMNVEQIFSKLKGRITREEFQKRIREKIDEFNGLLSEEGAALIVAADLGVRLRQHSSRKDQMGITDPKEKNERRQPVSLKAMEQIRMLDTSGYEASPMVEKMLVDQIEEQKAKIEKLEEELVKRAEEIKALNVRVAILNGKAELGGALSPIRTLAGILFGIFGTLVFTTESLLRDFSLVVAIFFIALFLLTYHFGREKHEQK